MRRLILMLLTLTLAAAGLSACGDPYYAVTQITSTGNAFLLRHDWSPAVPYDTSNPTSCLFRSSDQPGRSDLCRVVDGYGPDHRDWGIDFVGTMPIGLSDASLLYGQALVTPDGVVYEGCQQDSGGGSWKPITHAGGGGGAGSWPASVDSDSHWRCDYRTRKPVVVKYGTSFGSWILRKAWTWTRAQGDAVGCASAIVATWGAAIVTPGIFFACDDGPA